MFCRSKRRRRRRKISMGTKSILIYLMPFLSSKPIENISLKNPLAFSKIITFVGTGELRWEENSSIPLFQGLCLPVQYGREPGKGFLASPGENISFICTVLWYIHKGQCRPEKPLDHSLSPLLRVIWIKIFLSVLSQAESKQKGIWPFVLLYCFLICNNWHLLDLAWNGLSA